MHKSVKIVILAAVLSMGMADNAVQPSKSQEAPCAHMSAEKSFNAIGVGPTDTNKQTGFRGAGASRCF